MTTFVVIVITFVIHSIVLLLLLLRVVHADLLLLCSDISLNLVVFHISGPLKKLRLLHLIIIAVIVLCLRHHHLLAKDCLGIVGIKATAKARIAIHMLRVVTFFLLSLGAQDLLFLFLVFVAYLLAWYSACDDNCACRLHLVRCLVRNMAASTILLLLVVGIVIVAIILRLLLLEVPGVTCLHHLASGGRRRLMLVWTTMHHVGSTA